MVFEVAWAVILIRQFLRHDVEARQLRWSEGGGYRDIGRVSAARHDNSPDARTIMAGVEREPAAGEEDLEPGAKIHRRGILGHTDIPEIARAVAGGNIHAATQRHSKVGKVPADADALGMSFGRGAVAPGMVVTKFDMVMHVVADRLHALPAPINAAELGPCEVGKFFRIAVAAPQQIQQRFVGQGGHIPLRRIRHDLVWQAAVSDDEVIANL